MIRYALTCDSAHRFESWFQSGSAFDTLRQSKMITCPDCGSTDISKTVMAPMVQKTDAVTAPKPVPEADLAKLRDHVEKTSDYVGSSFASEARAMHLGDKPERPIYGEANQKEARDLIMDGVPVLPLPFMPKKSTH